LRHTQEGFSCVSVHNGRKLLAEAVRFGIRCHREEGLELLFLVCTNKVSHQGTEWEGFDQMSKWVVNPFIRLWSLYGR
jgi:hypothetical protein